jgi:hypothetical protein
VYDLPLQLRSHAHSKSYGREKEDKIKVFSHLDYFLSQFTGFQSCNFINATGCRATPWKLYMP